MHETARSDAAGLYETEKKDSMTMKQYIKPETDVLDIHHDTRLLTTSASGDYEHIEVTGPSDNFD